MQGTYNHRFLEYASKLLNAYAGDEPFHLYLKKYFSAHKKHGSRDRKLITRLCYAFFRLGNGVISNIEPEERMLLGIFLTEFSPTPLLEERSQWNEKISLPLRDKIKEVSASFDPQQLFKQEKYISNQIQKNEYALSFLQQPKVFIRIRPGRKAAVMSRLASSELAYSSVGNDVLTFSNSKQIEEVVHINKDAVVQDLSSQQVLNMIIPLKEKIQSVWDCCAGSGGKSILLRDKIGKVNLTVSDSRKNILGNLKHRFSRAGIRDYRILQTDLSETATLENFDLILADVPCSGSGTWARTPEQLQFFGPEKLEQYVSLQRTIISNTHKHLNPGGYYLYITCSVFSKENEKQTSSIEKECGLNLIRSQYITGYQQQADTLFTALFQKR